jgi:hypothetical protein
VQTAALRYELGDEHTYTFLQGTVVYEMAPEVAPLSDSNIDHYAYYHPTSAHSYLRALDALENYVQAEGPFDGVLGFSQGAGMALMYLIRHAHLYPERPLPFKVAVLLSRIGVYNPARWLETGEAVMLETLPLGIDRLAIPVAAVWGENDWKAVQEEGRVTKNLCGEGMVWEFVHKGSHEVPGASVEGSVQGAVKDIRRAITQAQIMEHGDQ